MSANVDRVEHAITESLNGMQLGEKCVVQTELNELRALDPGHWKENVKLFAKMTSNYQGFPHLEIENAAAHPDAPVACTQGRDCHKAGPDLPPAPPPQELPQAPRFQQEIAPPQPRYEAPPPVDYPVAPAQQFQPPPEAPIGPGFAAAPPYAPPESNLGSNLVNGLAEGFGAAAGLALGGRLMRHEMPPWAFRHNWGNSWNNGFIEQPQTVFPEQFQPSYIQPYDPSLSGDYQSPVAAPYIVPYPVPYYRHPERNRRY